MGTSEEIQIRVSFVCNFLSLTYVTSLVSEISLLCWLNFLGAVLMGLSISFMGSIRPLELDLCPQKLLIPASVIDHVDWRCHSSSWLLLSNLAPSINKMMAMNQKSVLSRALAKPPRITTVAQIKPRVPRPVAAFSRTTRRRANNVSFFSGARTAGRVGKIEFLLFLSLIPALVCSSKIVAGEMMVSFFFLTGGISRWMLLRPSAEFFTFILQSGVAQEWMPFYTSYWLRKKPEFNFQTFCLWLSWIGWERAATSIANFPGSSFALGPNSNIVGLLTSEVPSTSFLDRPMKVLCSLSACWSYAICYLATALACNQQNLYEREDKFETVSTLLEMYSRSWYYTLNDLGSWIVHRHAQLLVRHWRWPQWKEDQSWSWTFQGFLLQVSLRTRVIGSTVPLQVISIRSSLEIATLLAAVLFVRICQSVLYPCSCVE